MGMQLVMTPQLQMAIRLLQMSSLELADYLQEELDKNPLLERADDGSGSSSEVQEAQETPTPTQESPPEQSAKKEEAPTDSATSETQLNDELPVDADWSDVYGDSGPGTYENSGSTEAPPLENTLTRGETLADHLTWQLGVSAMNDRERELGLILIDAIDDNGYLTTSLQAMSELTRIPEEELEDVLTLVHSFEPAGVGARDLAECLRLQLKNLKMARQPYTGLLEHLNDLARRDFRKLRRILKLNEEELAEAVAVIHSLNPKPGLAFGHDHANYVAPDVFVRKHEGKWVVEVNPDTMPKLRINRYYQDNLSSRASASDKRFLTENARSAQWLIKSLEQRASTIYRVAESIVRFQQDFLDHGQEYLKPLILKDVADDIGVHESTTSRVTSNKYMHTPRGIFELKYFFSSSLSSPTGDTHSSEAVKYKIRKLVDSEPPRRPFSDEKLARLLQEQGVEVARRTVAKYRDSMGIPSSSRRKQLS
ncbi:MAG: RNA polymerase factor sigma-54 [Magnetococcales bacterium]|nr:RNA polymerase factor sigma-54 [Magnetococcales bacterium]